MVSLSVDDVMERFALTASLGAAQAEPFRFLCVDAVSETETKEREDCGDSALSALLSAAACLAFYRYTLMRAPSAAGTFSAGDVKITEDGASIHLAKKLWRESLAAAAPYLTDTGFIFGRTRQ